MKNLQNSEESLLGVRFLGGCEFNPISYQSTIIAFLHPNSPIPSFSVTLGKFEYVNPRVSLSTAHLDRRANHG